MADILYKDTDDVATSNMINEYYGENYWSLGEEEVLNYGLDYIRQISAKK